MASDTPPDDTPPDPNPLDTTSPKGGSYGGPYNPTDLDPNVRATMIGSRWTTEAGGLIPETQLTYYFSTSADDYTPSPATRPPRWSPTAPSARCPARRCRR